MTHAPVAARAVWPTVILAALGWVLLAFGAWAQPAFPELTGRVVDRADLLSPAVETSLTQRLEALERDTSDQLVVVTIPDLGGYEISDYGYQLGRHWGIGQEGTDNGVLLIVARDDRKVRIEVGYGLEPILTDALSSVIIQNDILPAFRSGDFEAGVQAGVGAIETQLRLDPAEAQARAAAAQPAEGDDPVEVLVLVVLVFGAVIALIIGTAIVTAGRSYRGRPGLAPILIWTAAEMMRSSGDGGGGRSSSGGGFGGFSGGGGSFGGGGASGGW